MIRPHISSNLFRQRWATDAGGETPLYTFVSISPDSGSQDGGEPVTITISGFNALDTNEVRFGCDASGDGGDVASFSAVNSTVIDVTTPLSTSGTGTKNVVVEVSALQRAVGIAVFTFNASGPP
jgi:hypothetical protein